MILRMFLLFALTAGMFQSEDISNSKMEGTATMQYANWVTSGEL